jgi:hypothetical protein
MHLRKCLGQGVIVVYKHDSWWVSVNRCHEFGGQKGFTAISKLGGGPGVVNSDNISAGDLLPSLNYPDIVLVDQTEI